MIRFFLSGLAASYFLIVPVSALSPLVLRSQDHKVHIRGAPLSHSHTVKLIQRQHARQPSDTTRTTTHESFLERMGSAFMAMIIGIILILFSFPVLWLNEKRSAKQDALIAKGQVDCRSVSADDYDDKNMHWLVHVNGDTKSTQPVKDSQFNVHYDSGVVRISSRVQIYQWKETEKSEVKKKENNFGGGTTTETKKWKEYSREWLETYNGGMSFEKPEHKNTKPSNIEPGSFSDTCTRVEFGQGFLLGETELGQLSAGAYGTLPIESPLVCNANKDLDFVPAGKDWYYSGKGSMESPEIGAVRVSFSVLLDGPATIVGLQGKGAEAGRGGFLPYRVIRRPLCPCFGLSEEQEKQKLYDEAVKDKAEINDDDMWHGVMSFCCCACNIVQYCFGAVMLPEICNTFTGKLSKNEAFKLIRNQATLIKWVCRAVGWLMMFVGLCLIFSPFTTFLKIIPLGIGSFLSKVGGAIIFVCSFSVTLVVSIFIVSLAYSIYHPAFGIMMFGMLGVLIALFLVFCNGTQTK